MASLFSSNATASLLPPRYDEDELDSCLLSSGFYRSDFQHPDFASPFDVEARINATPSTASVKGVFVERIAKSARRFGVSCEPHYSGFRDYPMRDYMNLIYHYGRVRYPRLSTGESLRRVGWETFPALLDSILGRVLFSAVDGDLRVALKLTPQAYSYSVRPGTVRLAYISDHQAVLELRGIWNFPDAFQVGVMEGGCRYYRPSTTIWRHSHSHCDVDLLIRW